LAILVGLPSKWARARWIGVLVAVSVVSMGPVVANFFATVLANFIARKRGKISCL
jgi:hypothetical protein